MPSINWQLFFCQHRYQCRLYVGKNIKKNTIFVLSCLSYSANTRTVFSLQVQYFTLSIVNFVSARPLLTAAIFFVQAVAQLLKPHLIALLHLASCLQRWSCAWMKNSQDSQFVNCMPWAIFWWEHKPTQCSRKSFTYVSIFSSKQSISAALPAGVFKFNTHMR